MSSIRPEGAGTRAGVLALAEVEEESDATAHERATDDGSDACVDRLARGGGRYQRLDCPGALLLRLGLRPEPLLLLVVGELPGIEGGHFGLLLGDGLADVID